MLEQTQKTEEDHLAEARDRLLDAALPHVAFDGWSDACFQAALADVGENEALYRLACPRGGLDLALAYHRRGDAEMLASGLRRHITGLRYSEKVAAFVRLRLEVSSTDAEIVRRGVAFFAMPAYASEGAAAVWQTCDLIWKALGDTSDDLNWYSKRAILSAVYSSTVLFWLGDDSENHQATWDFLDRRIANVMQFEKVKGQMRGNPLVKAFMRGPGQILERIKSPNDAGRPDLPGHMTRNS